MMLLSVLNRCSTDTLINVHVAAGLAPKAKRNDGLIRVEHHTFSLTSVSPGNDSRAASRVSGQRMRNGHMTLR